MNKNELPKTWTKDFTITYSYNNTMGESSTELTISYDSCNYERHSRVNGHKKGVYVMTEADRIEILEKMRALKVNEHNLPNTRSAYDAYDYYAVYRILDALIDYSFNGNTSAKEVALGNGAAAQVTLPGGLTPLEVTDTPVAAYAQSRYRFPCYNQKNPRANYCGHDARPTGRLRDRLGKWRSQ